MGSCGFGVHMLNRITRSTAILITVGIITAGAIGCSSASTTATRTTTAPTTTMATTGIPTQTPTATSANATEAAIRAYADPATVTTLQGLSENNLAKYTEDADAQFKAALTQTKFEQVYAQINNQLGTFESATFLSTEKQQGYTVVHYQATYSKQAIGVRMVFDQDHLVAGQFFEPLP